MKIRQALFSRGVTGFFFDDQKAIKGGLAQDGFVYLGKPVTDGFEQVRQAGESISVMLVLDSGDVAMGDCAAVQYSGTGGRDPLFLAETYVPFLESQVAPLLAGSTFATFREAAAFFDGLKIGGRRLHTAIRYGLSQALLDAQARATGRLMAEVIAEEYGLPLVPERVPVFAQSGDDRYGHVDKMILKQVEVLPHALINNVDTKLGRKGEILADYVAWLSGRIQALRPSGAYRPALHIDVYGTIGLAFDHDAR
ncbi:MAG TPA: methylaspartate ammonia-lyase, partial [Holophaga sp.]|nr:methylaspartate ammonia-lyase [Holophaga sp.]